jgi:hypothetical protein
MLFFSLTERHIITRRVVSSAAVRPVLEVALVCFQQICPKRSAAFGSAAESVSSHESNASCQRHTGSLKNRRTFAALSLPRMSSIFVQEQEHDEVKQIAQTEMTKSSIRVPE